MVKRKTKFMRSTEMGLVTGKAKVDEEPEKERAEMGSTGKV
jgi:hypothetical protein